MNLSSDQRTLVLAGAILFLLGLVEGAVLQSFHNPRMALSAHLTAVQSAMSMMLAGLLWTATHLPEKVSAMGKWGIVIGMFALWIGLTGAAMTGASSILPIAGAGHQAGPIAEMFVAVAVFSGSFILTVGWSIFIWGLLRARRA